MQQVAVYANWHQYLGDHELTVGGRYSDYSIDLNSPQIADDQLNLDDLTWHVSWLYRINEADRVFANIGRGFRPPNIFDLGQVGDGRSSDLAVEKEGLGLNGFTNKETNGGQHGNTSVGKFGLTVSLQGAFIGLGGETKRIEKTHWLEGSWDRLNCESRALSDWSLVSKDGKGRGRSDEGGGKDELHFDD